VVFLVIDVSLLQPLGVYTNRWLQIGGGSNWWYHPVWWMVGTFLPWMGAQILASQARRTGRASVAAGLVMALAATLVCWLIGVLVHVPGAGWTLGSFGVAWLPGVTVAAMLGALRARRG
jgi:cobalamin biosynthesis protein CobD/CbiB